MNVKEIKELMKVFNDSDMTEFHLSSDEFEVQFSKREEYPQVVSNTVTASPVVPVQQEGSVEVSQPVSTEEKPVDAVDAKYITSPIVGVVYLQSSPDADPFVSPGKTIHADETVCIIEAMKIMNEIKSDLNGEIVEVLVENGQMVDFGQKLFAIR